MKPATTPNSALKILWKAKFFFHLRGRSEIKKKLERHGYNFSDAALGMALLRAQFLTKKGTKGDYSYVQKHPYVDDEESEE